LISVDATPMMNRSYASVKNPHPRDEDRPQVESAQRCVIEGADQAARRRLRHVVPFTRQRFRSVARGEENSSFEQISPDLCMNGK